MKGHWFLVSGDPAMARDTVYATLANQGFALTPLDAWTAYAERGSASASMALGAFAGKKGRHVKINIVCQSTPEGLSITLTQMTSGISGGLIGRSQADAIYSDIYSTVGTAFCNAGVLITGRNI